MRQQQQQYHLVGIMKCHGLGTQRTTISKAQSGFSPDTPAQPIDESVHLTDFEKNRPKKENNRWETPGDGFVELVSALHRSGPLDRLSPKEADSGGKGGWGNEGSEGSNRIRQHTADPFSVALSLKERTVVVCSGLQEQNGKVGLKLCWSDGGLVFQIRSYLMTVNHSSFFFSLSLSVSSHYSRAVSQ